MGVVSAAGRQKQWKQQNTKNTAQHRLSLYLWPLARKNGEKDQHQKDNDDGPFCERDETVKGFLLRVNIH